jgi:hypothetical protein
MDVRDSSIWVNAKTHQAQHAQDNRLLIGVVREVRNVKDTNELRYMVEVYSKNDTLIVPCRMMRKLSGVYNYEDIVQRGYNYHQANNNQSGTLALAGDMVLVGFIGGSGREGIILGGMTHPARTSFLDSTKGPQYRSEFNGIETSINEEGEWTLTFKGQPTNLNKLSDAPNQPIAKPTYNTDVGSSYMKWDKEGSFTLSDEAADPDKAQDRTFGVLQKLFIDKTNGTIDIFSGKINLNFKKSEEKVSLTNKITMFTSEDSISYTTKKFKGDASEEIRVHTPLYVVESDRIRLGDESASEWVVIGTTFRSQQKTMNDTVSQQLIAASAALITAATALTTAGASMVVPIVGPVVAAPQVTAAGAAVLTASTAVAQAGAAIASFEATGALSNYLSSVTKTK